MSIFCHIIVSVLCVHVPPGSNFSAKVADLGHGGKAIVEGPGWKADFYTHLDLIIPFKREGASKTCVGEVCVEYRKRCNESGKVCDYDINTGLSTTTIVLSADDENAAAIAKANLGLHREFKPKSDFPLALLDTNVTRAP